MISSAIKWKIWLVIGILLLSIVVNIAAWQYVARKNSARLEYLSSVLIPTSQKGQELVGEFKTQYRHYQDSVMFGDLGLLAEAASVRQRIDKVINDLIAETKMPEGNRSMIEHIYDEYIQYSIAAEYVYGLLADSSQEKNQNAQNLTPELNERKEYLAREFQVFSDIASQDLHDEITTVNSNTRRVNNALTYFTIIVVLITLGVNVFIVKVKIHRPIDAIIDQINVEKNGKILENQMYQRHRLESLGELAGGVAHEINTPIACVQNNLSIMNSYTDMLKEIIRISEQMLESDTDQLSVLSAKMRSLDRREDFHFVLTDIERLLFESSEASRRISSIVANMLLFARPDATDIVRYNVIDGLKAALRIMRSEISEKCRIIEDYQVVPDIFGYPGDMNLAFLSIINNAVQSIPEEGKIWLSVNQEGGQIYISIRDNGCGMSDEDMKCIFDPFYSTRPQGKGLGLGLAVAHSVVSKHDGRIEVKSEIGKGSTFTVILPEVSRISREFRRGMINDKELCNV